MLNRRLDSEMRGVIEYPAKYVTVYNGSTELPMLTAEVFGTLPGDSLTPGDSLLPSS